MSGTNNLSNSPMEFTFPIRINGRDYLLTIHVNVIRIRPIRPIDRVVIRRLMDPRLRTNIVRPPNIQRQVAPRTGVPELESSSSSSSTDSTVSVHDSD